MKGLHEGDKVVIKFHHGTAEGTIVYELDSDDEYLIIRADNKETYYYPENRVSKKIIYHPIVKKLLEVLDD